MSIKAYVGRMGSGKTYEVVTEVILGGLRRGRRVVSNIAGLDFEAMKEVLIAEGVAEDDIGELVGIEHAKVVDPNFWRTDKDDELGVNAFIQPGDLLALDEIWRFWGGFGARDDEGKKRPDRVMNFYRMHRHFTHPDTGVACDVALITQDVMDISRQVRAVIEETYYMEKLTAVGSTSRYRVDIFQGGKTSRRPLRSIPRKYNPAYFGLYSSHSQKKEGDAAAREENIDGRGNILKGAIFKVVLPLFALISLVAVWFLWGFFHPKPSATTASTDDKKEPAAAAVSPAKHSTPDQAEGWRAAGYYQVGGVVNFLLLDGDRARVLLNPPSHKISATTLEVFLPSGEVATSWGGDRKGGLIDKAAGATK